jgi:hypothetical protein
VRRGGDIPSAPAVRRRNFFSDYGSFFSSFSFFLVFFGVLFCFFLLSCLCYVFSFWKSVMVVVVFRFRVPTEVVLVMDLDKGGVSDGLGVLVVRRLLPWLLCSPKLFCQWLLLPLYSGSGDWFWLLELRRWLWCVLCVLGDFLCLMVVVIGGDEEVMCLSSYW